MSMVSSARAAYNQPFSGHSHTPKPPKFKVPATKQKLLLEIAETAKRLANANSQGSYILRSNRLSSLMTELINTR